MGTPGGVVRAFALLLLACAAATPDAAAVAQEGSGAAVVTVLRADGDLPLVGARVTLRRARRSGITDERGVARLSALAAGTDTAQVLLVGYAPRSVVLTIRSGDIARVTVALTREAQALTPVDVTARRAALSFDHGFNARRRMGFGEFVAREDIDARRSPYSTDLLRGLPGVLVTHGRAGNGVRMARNTAACHVRYWVDGMLVPDDDRLPPNVVATADRTHGSSDETGGATTIVLARVNADVPTFDLDMIPPDDIEAIEVYRGPAETPAEFRVMGAPCGVIVVWTRTR